MLSDVLDPALLRAVISAPDDDLPRLVCADWLDGRGESERASFIRQQLRKATDPEYHGFLCLPERPCENCRREAATAARCSFDEWPSEQTKFHLFIDPSHVRPMPPTRPTGYAVFVRGFVSQVTCTWADWQQHADAILAACPIRGAKDGCVRLTTWPVFIGRAIDSGNKDDLIPVDLNLALPPPEEVMAAMVHRWPGVRFELPAGTEYLSTHNAGRIGVDMGDEQSDFMATYYRG